MERKTLIIGGIVSLIVAIIIVLIILLIANLANKPNENIIEQNIVESNDIEQNTATSNTEDPLVVFIENKEEEQQTQEEPIPVRDAATLTQEVYSINGPIGTLNIPKTGLNTEVYSNVTVSQMEATPCFLYTTGGLNEKGTTIFVGHNRENGLLFSDNKMLEENDEFYFTDLNGVQKKYIVYSKFVTDNDDVSFYSNAVDSPVIAMQCCVSPENEEQVIIVMGKAEN